jgi:hypothetical protein
VGLTINSNILANSNIFETALGNESGG